jgi:hypothetical protein
MRVHTVDWETSMSGTDNRPRAPKHDGRQGRARRRSDSLQARARPAAAAEASKVKQGTARTERQRPGRLERPE